MKGVLIAKAVHVMLETLTKVIFSSSRKKKYFAKVLRKLDVKGYHLLPPGVRQENGTAP